MNPHVKRAPASVADVGQSFRSQRNDRTALRTGRELDSLVTVGCRHCELATQGSLTEGQREIVDQIVPVPFKPGILIDQKFDHEVAGRPVSGPRCPLAAECDVVVRRHSRPR